MSSPDIASNGDDGKNSVSFFEKVTQIYDSGISTKNKFVEQANDIIDYTKCKLDKISPDKVKQQVAQASVSLNSNFPYFAMLCRSHDQELKFLTTIAVAYQTRKFGRRIFFVSTVSAYLLSSSTIFLAQYKWLSETPSEKKAV